MSQKLLIEINAVTIAKIFFFGIGVFLLVRVIDIVGAVLISVVIASAIEPAIVWFKKIRVPRTIAVLILYIIIFLAFLLSVYSLVPSLVSELIDFTSQIPIFAEEILSQLNSKYEILPLDIVINQMREFIVTHDFSFEENAKGFLTGASSIFGGFFTLIIIIVVSFYLAVQENGIAKFLRVISPEEYEKYVVSVWTRSQKKIERWLQGQIILGLIVGSVVYVGLTLMNVSYAPTLAVLAAVFELIPFFGPIMAAIPAIIVATFQAPILGLFVLIFYFVVQQLENHLIYPVVVRKMIGIPPMIVILSLIIGGRLAGLLV